MGSIHHLIDWLGIVDVGGPTTVLIARASTIDLSIAIEILEFHPLSNLRGSPITASLSATRDPAKRAVPEILC